MGNMIKLTKEQIKDLTDLLSAVWHGNKKMVEHCLKTSKYIYINGRFIYCCESKPTINTTMWYDDETPDPGKNFERFLRYNMRYAPEPLGEDVDRYLLEQYHGHNTGRLMGITGRRHYDTVLVGYIKMTNEEIEAVNAARQEVREDFEKRLTNYYKRYSHCVHSSGYWVNR